MDKNCSMMEYWLTQATKLIRFGPDRRAVEAELREHIEDKILDLLRIYPDMSETEAQERALSQMGNAQEIGRELARIHRPWMGYLWRTSQLMLCLLLLWLVYWCSVGFARLPGYQRDSFFTNGIDIFMYRNLGLEEGTLPTPLKLPEPVTVGNYTISVVQADLWSTDEEKPDWSCERELYLILEVEYDRLWERPHQLPSYIWAVDNLGGRVLSRAESELDPRNPLDTNSGVALYEGPRMTRYELVVPVPNWEADRIDLRYTRFGTEFTIPIDLKEGAG